MSQTQEEFKNQTQVFLDAIQKFIDGSSTNSEEITDQVSNIKILYRNLSNPDFTQNEEAIDDTKNMLKELIKFLYALEESNIDGI